MANEKNSSTRARRSRRVSSIAVDSNVAADVERDTRLLCHEEYSLAFGETFFEQDSVGRWVVDRWAANHAPQAGRPPGSTHWPADKRAEFERWRSLNLSNREIEVQARELYQWVRAQVALGMTDTRDSAIRERVQTFRESRGLSSVGLGGVFTALLWDMERRFSLPHRRSGWQSNVVWANPASAFVNTFESEFDRVYREPDAMVTWASKLGARELSAPFAGFVELVEKEAVRFPMREHLEAVSVKVVAA